MRVDLVATAAVLFVLGIVVMVTARWTDPWQQRWMTRWMNFASPSLPGSHPQQRDELVRWLIPWVGPISRWVFVIVAWGTAAYLLAGGI
jgi:hypothetical protein